MVTRRGVHLPCLLWTWLISLPPGLVGMRAVGAGVGPPHCELTGRGGGLQGRQMCSQLELGCSYPRVLLGMGEPLPATC